MKRLIWGLFMAGGVVVLAAGVLVTVEKLLSNPAHPRNAGARAPDPSPTVAQRESSRSTGRNFSIKRTKSEVGYTYWILEGFGRYKCFILCDSWEEALDQAKVRMEQVDAVFADSNF